MQRLEIKCANYVWVHSLYITKKEIFQSDYFLERHKLKFIARAFNIGILKLSPFLAMKIFFNA